MEGSLVNSSLLNCCRILLLVAPCFLLAACISLPGSVREESVDSSASVRKGSTDFGPFPKNYKNIVKSYLRDKTRGEALDFSSIIFTNTPNKLRYKNEYGYRVCLQIETLENKFNRTHFFLLNKNQVIEHEYYSGLASFLNKSCNTGSSTNDISGSDRSIDLEDERMESDVDGIKYIVCHVGKDEMLFIFDEKNNHLQQEYKGRVINTFSIKEITNTVILADDGDDNLTINRISGSMIYEEDESDILGHCEQHRHQKF